LRDRKVSVLRAVASPTRETVKKDTVRGRYVAGSIGDREVPSYVDEDGVDPDKRTETFAQVTLHVDSWRWAGVPFVLRSGKALERDRQEIAIWFKPVPHLAFGQSEQPVQNVLRLRLDSSPERLQLELNANGGDDLFDLAPLALDTELAPASLPAYAHVLLNVLRGDPVLSIRGDEAEEAWRIVGPILDAWRADEVPLVDYEAGSEGPASARAGSSAAG
ncbi:MAG TPA: hypothetical protein VF230_10390, partial [Acidimicrobiales bacterium]